MSDSSFTIGQRVVEVTRIGGQGPAGAGGATGPAGDVARAATRTALAAITGQAAGATRFLNEPGRQGLFEWDSSDLSAKVAADTQQGIYVPPASAPTGASGAWVRRFSGAVDPRWFGIVSTTGSYSSSNGSANSAAFLAMYGALRAHWPNTGSPTRHLGEVIFPPGYFDWASTLDLTDGALSLKGAGTGVFAGGHGTRLRFPLNTTGIRVQAYNTTGDNNTRSPTGTGADGSRIQGFDIEGVGYGTDNANYHGIHLRARAIISQCAVFGFQGDGIYIYAVAGGGDGGGEGNANNWSLEQVRIQSCRNGVQVVGPDVNAGVAVNVDGSSNRRWGIADRSFLGNTWIACHVDANQPIGTAKARCSANGNWYVVVDGQEAGASTNAPPATATNNTWWLYEVTGSPTANAPAWTSGLTWQSGGGYLTTNANARSFFSGCYSESGQPISQINAPSLVVGGLHGAGNAGSSGITDASLGGPTSNSLMATNKVEGAIQYRVQLGELAIRSSGLVLGRTGASDFRMGFSWANAGSADIWLGHGNNQETAKITSSVTAEQFGTGAAQPYHLHAMRLAIGSFANGRIMDNGTAAPTSASGRGQIRFNLTPNATGSGSNAGWICSTGGATPTYREFGGRAAAPTVTYSAPTGGTTVDTEGRAAIAQLAADIADLRAKLSAAGLTA